MTPHEMIPPSGQPAPATEGRPSARLGAALRWAGLIALGASGAVVVLALAVVATMAALIGVIVGAGVVLGLRLTAPARKRRDSALVLEGRRTADGWVVEAAAPKSR